jgi:hypothetical protein
VFFAANVNVSFELLNENRALHLLLEVPDIVMVLQTVSEHKESVTI